MQWSESEQFLVDMAECDLTSTGEVQPCLVAYRGDEPLLSAWVRPFPKGEYADPMIELLALVGGMGADRLALGIAGRVWSWEDPIPPVVEGVGDLRQRVLSILVVDGTTRPLMQDSVLCPFELGVDAVHWLPRLRPGPSEGWLQTALRACVEARDRLRLPVSEVADQAVRCLELGHEIAWPSEVVAEGN